MTTVQSPAPMRPCSKCGAEPGAYCRAIIGGRVMDRPLKGNRSHSARHPTRARPPHQPELRPEHPLGDPAAIDCPLCQAAKGTPCVYIDEAREAGTPRATPHLGRRLAAKG